MFVDRIMLINTRRELIYEGEFTYRRKTRKNYKVMHFFLFDDMLLLGRMKTGLDRFKGLKQATYVVAAHAYLPKVEIWDLENTPEESFTIGVQIGVKDYVVKFSSQADKEACMTTFFATRSKAHRINYVDPLPAKNKGRKGEEEEEEEESVPKAKTAPSPRKGKETATQKGKEKEKEKEKEEKQKAKEEKQREKAEKQKMKEEKKKQAQDQKAKEKEKKKEKEKQEKRQSTLPLARGRTLTTSLSAMTTNITEGSKQAGQRLSAMSTNITEGSKHAGQKLRSSVRN
jgi:type IV secretory pathway VirB10-like protein